MPAFEIPGAYLEFWAISTVIYEHKISLEKPDNYEAGLSLTLETNLCSKTKSYNFTSSLLPGLTSIHRKCLSYNSKHQVCGKMLVIQFSYNFYKWLKTGINSFLWLFDSNKTVW